MHVVFHCFCVFFYTFSGVFIKKNYPAQRFLHAEFLRCTDISACSVIILHAHIPASRVVILQGSCYMQIYYPAKIFLRTYYCAQMDVPVRILCHVPSLPPTLLLPTLKLYTLLWYRLYTCRQWCMGRSWLKRCVASLWSAWKCTLACIPTEFPSCFM